MGTVGGLFPQEVNALQRAADGHTYVEKKALATARLKLGARNTTHAVYLAFSEGLIS
jgi:hypothetical protein